MFTRVNKNNKDYWLPQLFDILCKNMLTITPTMQNYETQKTEYFTEVGPALKKPSRQNILAFDKAKLVGFIQFYMREGMLMVEELQLKKEYQQILLFFSFFKRLLKVMPTNLQTIEAYADRRNANSINLFKKLGRRITESDENSPFVHLLIGP